MEYYDGINQGDWYLCDRCEVSKLNEYEYNKNIRKEFRYCDECWNWINLKKWECVKCHSTGTNRSERTLTLKHCEEDVVWLA